MPRILHSRPFELDDVEIVQSGRVWSANAPYDACVHATWRQRQQEAADAGSRIWDGTYYRAENAEELEKLGGSLLLRLGTTSYRYISTYGLLKEQHARHALDPLHHLSTAALIRTTDNWYVFGRRTKNGSVDLIGGGVQPDELEVTSGNDLEQNLVKEIREETEISRTDMRKTLGLGVLRSSTTNVLVLSKVDLNVPRRAVEQAFRNREEDEMAEAVFAQEDQLRAFLCSLTDYRKLMPALLDGLTS